MIRLQQTLSLLCLKIRVIVSGNQICFFFIVNIEKIKIRITKYTSTEVHRRNHYPKHVFSWVLFNPRTTHPPTSYPPTYRPPTQQLAESIIILERLDNRNMFILQNTSTALGKHITILRYIIEKVYWIP